MNRIQRLQELNRLLKHHEGHTLIELMAKLDVSERAVRKYIEQIQLPPYKAELWNEYRGKERLYRYVDVSYNLPLFENTDEMKAKLDEALQAVEQYEGIPQFDWLKLCLVAIENGSIEGISSIMSFDNNADLEGVGYIKMLIEAIAKKYPIKLTYQPYKAEEQTHYVHPYHLKQYNNRWFLIGLDEKLNKICNYGIDRIKDVGHLSKTYIESDIDFEEYFDDVVGVSVNDNSIEEVVMMVNKDRYPYIKTKPLHWSQKHIKEQDNENFVCLSIKVKPNKELDTLIMSYGPDIIVQSPNSLREKISKKIEELHNAYNK